MEANRNQLDSNKHHFDFQMMQDIISLLRLARVFPTALVLIVLAVVEVLLESQGEFLTQR
jgi:hypothetical protein